MLVKRIIIFCIITAAVLTGCKQETTKPEPGLNEKFNFNSDDYQNALKNRFTDNSFAPYLSDSSFQYLDTLKTFYASRDFNPFFINSFESVDTINSILSVLEKADEHGLDKELYHFSIIADELNNAINDTIKNPDRLKQLANSELFLADAILKYSYHMRYGVVNPKLLFPDSYTLPVIDSSKRDIFEPLKQNDIVDYLNDVQPKNDKYKKLQVALKHFEKFKNINWDEIEYANKFEPGDKDSSLVQIAARLIVLGYLDTSEIKIEDFAVYDSLLIGPIKKFQKLSGLNEDGVIGKTTIEKLNTAPEEYIAKIKVNLERFRWNDYSDTSRYILVNIPDFKLFAIDDGEEILEIKVCTGSKRSASFKKQMQLYKKTKKIYHKPEDWETPCLYGQISYMVLNPTWTVPASIIREEILREVKKDSSYLQSKNFKVYQNGIELNLHEVNIKEFSSEEIPYTIVQDPGAGNALGKIKFMFKNPFGVYLHDTPSRVPFSYSNRAVSHGCVRVEKPLMLSEYILKDHSKWDIDYIRIEIGQQPEDKSKIAEYREKRKELRKNRSFGKTTEIVLDGYIPLFIDYYTAWVDKDGEVNFRDDVYHKDQILKDYLFPEKDLEKNLTAQN